MISPTHPRFEKKVYGSRAMYMNKSFVNADHPPTLHQSHFLIVLCICA